MENFKVRLVEGAESKGVAQTEADLLAKHEADQAAALAADSTGGNEGGTEGSEEQTTDLREEDVLSYIGKRYNKQINSFDELMAERQQAEQMPEDVAAYMKFKKETGRGFEDFIKLRKDFDSMDGELLLKEYLQSTQEGLDSDDIEALMEDYRYDEDSDDEYKIKKVRIATKQAINEAKKYFNAQKEKYKLPLESRSEGLSQEQREEFQAYQEYVKSAKTTEEENNRKRQWFDQKTGEVFDKEFKGFEFNIDSKKIVFSPGDATELKKNQSTPANFINRFLDENGLMKDAVGYHRSLAIAMNPEKFAKFFYEQGAAEAKDGTMRNIKNINMSTNRATEATASTEGPKVRAVNPDSGRSLKIRSAKRV